MEMLQATMDKMLLNFKRLATFFGIVLFIVLPVVLTVTSMYKDSGLGIFKGLSKARGAGRPPDSTVELFSGGPNATTTNGLGLEGRPPNVTHEDSGGREKDSTGLEVLQGKAQNETATEGKEMNTTAAYVADLATIQPPSSITKPINNHSSSSSITHLSPESSPSPSFFLATAATATGSKNDLLTSSTNDSTSHSGNHDDKDALIDDEKHKLIDGLLASGFDESSCMSRFESHLYRKPSSHKPSPYLISKLRNYEAIHRRCGPKSRAYKRAMKKITSSNKNHVGDAATMCKYIVWTPSNGLGNRIMSMASTFLYAVLTDRVLLVSFGNDMHGLFCEPFLNSTWILPRNSPFWNFQHVETYQRVLEKDKANNLTIDLLPPALFLHLAHTEGGSKKFFHCDHNQELLQRVHLLIVFSDQYFVPSLFMIPSFSLELNKMFPAKDTVFHHVGRYLFHPSNEAWGQISRFYQAYLAKADERIGLQIRLFKPDSTPHQAVMDLLLSCTTKNEILPQVDMQNSVASNGKNQTLKAVLVASLYPQYGDNLRAMYLNRPTVTGEVIGVYQPSHEEKEKFNDNLHYMKAWIDMYLLSLSDVLVTTSLSTFGYVAQGLGGLKPWLLYKLISNETRFPACERDLSPEPCYHSPPRLECNGELNEHFASSFPHLFPCKDYNGGVKLVNGSADQL